LGTDAGLSVLAPAGIQGAKSVANVRLGAKWSAKGSGVNGEEVVASWSIFAAIDSRPPDVSLSKGLTPISEQWCAICTLVEVGDGDCQICTLVGRDELVLYRWRLVSERRVMR
jgi:hypothetical protein